MKQLNLVAALLLLTFNCLGQDKQETLNINWPQEYHWKALSNEEDKEARFSEMIPAGETEDNWTILASVMALKHIKVTSIDRIVQMYKESSRQESPRALLTVLEKSGADKNIWVLFKIETESFPDDPKPESQLYYALQGEDTLYVNFVAVKKEGLSEEFVSAWTAVFKSSALVYK